MPDRPQSSPHTHVMLDDRDWGCGATNAHVSFPCQNGNRKSSTALMVLAKIAANSGKKALAQGVLELARNSVRVTWFKGRTPELPNSKLGVQVCAPSDLLTKLASVSCLGVAVVFPSLCFFPIWRAFRSFEAVRLSSVSAGSAVRLHCSAYIS